MITLFSNFQLKIDVLEKLGLLPHKNLKLVFAPFLRKTCFLKNKNVFKRHVYLKSVLCNRFLEIHQKTVKHFLIVYTNGALFQFPPFKIPSLMFVLRVKTAK